MSTERVERKWKEGISSSIKYTILESFKDITATNEISEILNDVTKKRTAHNERKRNATVNTTTAVTKI